jgi:hypothetical protein
MGSQLSVHCRVHLLVSDVLSGSGRGETGNHVTGDVLLTWTTDLDYSAMRDDVSIPPAAESSSCCSWTVVFGTHVRSVSEIPQRQEKNFGARK